MSNEDEPIRFRCYACGEAENCDSHCDFLGFTADVPEFCPHSGEECEWIKKENK